MEVVSSFTTTNEDFSSLEKEKERDPVTKVLEVGEVHKAGIYVTMQVEQQDVKFLLDTGSAVSILSHEIYQSKFADKHLLQPAAVQLQNYSRQRIPLLGCFVATVTYKGSSASLVLYVVSQGSTLLGLDGLSALRLRIDGSTLQCMETSTPISTDLKSIIDSTYAHLFTPGIGMAKGYEHLVKVKRDVPPVAVKLRRLPLTIREEVPKELLRLLDMDIIKPVTASEWVSPIVVVRKKD